MDISTPLGNVAFGSLADWMSALGTATATLLAMYIILRDRRRDEKNEASKVSFRYEGTSHLVIHNGADRPITEIVLFSWYGRKINSKGERTKAGPPSIRADEECSVELFETNNAPTDPIRHIPASAVHFKDADGQSWIRHLDSGEMVRLRSVHSPAARRAIRRRCRKLIRTKR